MFSINRENDELESLTRRSFSDLGISEPHDLQEWVIEEPGMLGEDLLVITSEYAKFEDTLDRLDVLALDREGKLVLIELKRDKAEENVDLQALKYASFCSTLTAAEVQKDYRDFWQDDDQDLTPEDVGTRFAEFLDESSEEPIQVTDEGWADFDLDNRPRIILAAGSFGTEVTSPVTWLIEEYGLNITCVRLEAYEHQGRVLLNAQQVIPVPEAEEYMTRRRQKEQKQRTGRRPPAVNVLLERGVLQEGDILIFDEERLPDPVRDQWNPKEDFWRARATGETGQNSVEWMETGETFSFTRLTKRILQDLVGRDPDVALNGYNFWVHPEFNHRRLSDLRNAKVRGAERGD